MSDIKPKPMSAEALDRIKGCGETYQGLLEHIEFKDQQVFFLNQRNGELARARDIAQARVKALETAAEVPPTPTRGITCGATCALCGKTFRATVAMCSCEPPTLSMLDMGILGCDDGYLVTRPKDAPAPPEAQGPPRH